MITKIKEIRALFNQLVVTKHAYTMEEAKKGGVYTGMANKLKEYQQVLAVGPSVKGIQAGDWVFINPARYVVVNHKEGNVENNIIKDNMHATVNIPTYTLYGKGEDGVEISKEVMIIGDNDVHLCVPSGCLEEFNENPIIAPADGIIS